ncbi:MAG: sulfotransferase [Promethearchaeota archaeon]
MLSIKMKSKNNDSFKFPFLGYIGYGATKFFDSFKSFSFLLDKFESMYLTIDLENVVIDRPVYITGLARAGTTITLEMLSKHPDLSSHQYKNLLMPYLPHWFSLFIEKLKIYTKPFERIHMDGILITHESPEAVEEIFWQKFFENLHNEKSSNILDRRTTNPKFENFYQNHIRKLLIDQNKPRYVAKNNYHVSRFEYLLKLFPDVKFLLIIRNPVNQIASLIKQIKLFMRIECKAPLLQEWFRLIGHYEFGHHQVCINVGNTDVIRKIRMLWTKKETYVKGWAYYWNSIYEYLADNLEKNRKFREATLIINYDELCENPDGIIAKILEHTELSVEKFERVRKYYIDHLHVPNYYKPDFSQQELAEISEITKKTASRFGIKNTLINFYQQQGSK